MDRRAFLKTIAAGAVAAVVPLPAPAELVTITGTVTAHFENTALYEKVLSGNQVFVRWCQETVFCEHPAGMIHKLAQGEPALHGWHNHPLKNHQDQCQQP